MLHVETDVNANSFLVANEFLFVYDQDMNTVDYEWSEQHTVASVNSEVMKPIQLMGGGQSVGWLENNEFKSLKICSYSEYFDGSEC